MAAQPPRAPPNNLLFCGPPPTLPRVLLLPSDAVAAPEGSAPASGAPLDTRIQTNDEDALREINNVGVPTYDGVFDGQVENEVLNTENAEYQIPPENYLRRTHSFDISDIYTSHFDIVIDSHAFRHRRSEPDLSKYGLFVEAEVTVDCAALEHPQLVLNNPFYDGSYAMHPTQLTPTMVMLPENYLAFEDAFVPTWDYKPEYLIDRDLNTGLYYDGLPLIPTNDPWSAYCGDNAGFQYYSPHYETPIGDQDGINYMPLTDLDYAIPTYMSLPEVEQAQIEDTDASHLLQISHLAKVDIDSDNNGNLETNIPSDVSSVLVSDVVSEDEKNSVIDSSIVKESSAHSEESLNADISNDITSSLAFVPDSKSLQMPDGVDDTSDDTCSTDYHEASALDLVQSLDELSCCDSTDYSQSRDELSPALPPEVQPEKKAEEAKKTTVYNKELDEASCSTTSNLPLNQLPSIPIPDSLPPKLPSLERTTEKEANKVGNKQDATQANTQIHTNPRANNSKPTEKNDNLKNDMGEVKPAHHPPHPPAVPPSWLPRKPSSQHTSDKPINAVPPPQIRVQKVESRPAFEKSQKPPSLPQVKGNQQAAGEPQPSCSFATTQAAPSAHTSQLKLEKQPKEVEVSQHIILASSRVKSYIEVE